MPLSSPSPLPTSPPSYLYVRVSGMEQCNERLMCRVLLELHFERILPYVKGRGEEEEGRMREEGKEEGVKVMRHLQHEDMRYASSFQGRYKQA